MLRHLTASECRELVWCLWYLLPSLVRASLASLLLAPLSPITCSLPSNVCEYPPHLLSHTQCNHTFCNHLADHGGEHEGQHILEPVGNFYHDHHQAHRHARHARQHRRRTHYGVNGWSDASCRVFAAIENVRIAVVVVQRLDCEANRSSVQRP